MDIQESVFSVGHVSDDQVNYQLTPMHCPEISSQVPIYRILWLAKYCAVANSNIYRKTVIPVAER